MKDFLKKTTVATLIISLIVSSLFLTAPKAKAAPTDEEKAALGGYAKTALSLGGVYLVGIPATCLAYAEARTQIEIAAEKVKDWVLNQLKKQGGKIIKKVGKKVEGTIESAISMEVPVFDKTAHVKIDTAKTEIKKQEAKTAKETKKAQIRQNCQTILEKALKTTIKKRLLDVMVDQTVSWIQGNGRPKFVTDYKAFLSNAANEAVGDVVQEIGLGRICQPFKFQLQLTVANPPPFSTKAACTLDKIVGNIENFYNDFSQGGWLAYNEMLRPQNNIYGAFIMSQDEVLSRQAAAVEAAAQEVQAGSGFLSQKRCLLWSAVTPTEILTRADTGENKPPDNLFEWKCTQSQIVTPGQTIGTALSGGINADWQFIISADDASAYISALADAAIQRLVSEGMGLLGMRKPTISAGERLATTSYERFTLGEVQQSNFDELYASVQDLINNAFSSLVQVNNSIQELVLKINGDFEERCRDIFSATSTERQNTNAILAQAYFNRDNITEGGLPYYRTQLTMLKGEARTATSTFPTNPEKAFNDLALTNEDLLFVAAQIDEIDNQTRADLATINGYISACPAGGGGQH